MFEFIIQVIVEFIIYYLFSYPGALIRWMFLRKNKKFKEILNEDIYLNSAIGLLFGIPILVGIILILVLASR